jgi:hypothetical protein
MPHRARLGQAERRPRAGTGLHGEPVRTPNLKRTAWMLRCLPCGRDVNGRRHSSDGVTTGGGANAEVQPRESVASRWRRDASAIGGEVRNLSDSALLALVCRWQCVCRDARRDSFSENLKNSRSAWKLIGADTLYRQGNTDGESLDGRFWPLRPWRGARSYVRGIIARGGADSHHYSKPSCRL